MAREQTEDILDKWTNYFNKWRSDKNWDQTKITNYESVQTSIFGYKGSPNKNKICELLLYRGISIEGNATNAEDWKNVNLDAYYDNNSDTNERGVKNFIIHPGIKLYLDNMSSLEFSYKNTYQPITDVLNTINKDASTLLDSVSGLAAFGRGMGMGNLPRGGLVKSQYSDIEGWENTGPLEFSGTVSFTFQYGMANLFSAEEEVVKPIIKLAMMFAPKNNDTNKNLFYGPIPSKEELLARLLQGLASSAGNVVTEVSSIMFPAPKTTTTRRAQEENESDEAYQAYQRSQDEAEQNQRDREQQQAEARSKQSFVVNIKEGLGQGIEIITKIEDALVGAYDGVLQGILASGDPGIIQLKIGNITLGPCYVGGASWSFDYTNVDSAGYPTKGSLTLTDIKSINMASMRSIAGTYKSNVKDEKGHIT